MNYNREWCALAPAFRLLLACACYCASARAETLAVRTDYQGQQIEIQGDFEPSSSTGSRPVVIVLHDCGGLKASSNTWMATWLPFVRELGYAIFRPDSFTARGQTDTCDKQSLFEQQARDVFASALVLAGRPEVRRDRIAVLGHSHSGAAIIRYVVRDRPEFRPLRAGLAQRGANVVAAVAISPNCDPEIAYPVIIPTLLLTGALDDWTPASTCYDLIRDPASAAKLRAKVYPGAYHGFDVLGPPRTRLGHRIEYNKEATDDARTEARALLARLLQ